MEFPGAAVTVGGAFGVLTRNAAHIKSTTQGLRNRSLAGPVSFSDVFTLLGVLQTSRDTLASAVAAVDVNDLIAHVQQQVGASVNIVTKYNAMVDKLNETIVWIGANIPKDGNGFVLGFQMDANGNVVYRTFSTVDLAEFRNKLDALAATIS